MDDFVFEEKELPTNAPDHWRAFFDSRCLRHWHLGGKEMTFQITAVKLLRSKIRGQEKKQLCLHFRTSDLPLVLNVTNASTIAQLYGNKPQEWVGKRITLYTAVVQGFGKETEAIRVRPRKPEAPKRARGPQTPPPAEDPPSEPGRMPGDDSDELAADSAEVMQ